MGFSSYNHSSFKQGSKVRSLYVAKASQGFGCMHTLSISGCKRHMAWAMEDPPSKPVKVNGSSFSSVRRYSRSDLLHHRFQQPLKLGVRVFSTGNGLNEALSNHPVKNHPDQLSFTNPQTNQTVHIRRSWFLKQLHRSNQSQGSEFGPIKIGYTALRKHIQGTTKSHKRRMKPRYPNTVVSPDPEVAPIENLDCETVSRCTLKISLCMFLKTISLVDITVTVFQWVLQMVLFGFQRGGSRRSRWIFHRTFTVSLRSLD